MPATSEPVAMTMFLVSISSTLPSSPVTETLPAAKAVDLVLLEQEGDAVDVGRHRRVLVRHHLLQVQLRRADLDAERVEGMTGLGEHLGSMQQGLGRNAADVEACAAKSRVLLDHGGLQAKLSRLDGADIAARSRSDDNDVVSHDGVLLFGLQRPPLTFKIAPVV
jgi:hypothetical protein